MKFIRWTAFMVATLALLLSGVGCDSKSTGGGQTTGGEVGSVQIVLGTPNDTLRFLPGDSASTSVTIIVSDLSGLALPGQKVSVSLADNNLGVIEWVDSDLQDTTNAQGRVNATFRTYARAGNQVISATVGGQADNAILTILPADIVICNLRLTIADTLLEANDFLEDSTQVVLTITDCQGRGVPNVSLDLRSTGGRMQAPMPTDSGGRTQTMWYNNGQFGDFMLKISVGSFADSQAVHVVQSDPRLGYLTVTSDRLLVEADGCVTAANITAVLQNQYGEAIRGDTIRFGTPAGGAAQPYGVTDTLGRAFTIFCGMGIPNDQDPSDSSYVVARYDAWGLRDTVNVRINPASAIGEVNLSASATSGTAGRDSIELVLNVFFENGARVNGYYAQFRNTQCGSLLFDSTRLVNGSPDTTNFYKLCTSIPATPVEITAEVGGVFSTPLVIQTNPGSATFVQLEAIPLVNSGQSVDVFATVTDTFGNPVRQGTVVLFETTIGSLSPSNATTDILGIATTRLGTGTSAGDGVVRARLGNGAIDSTSLYVISGNPNSLTMVLNPSSMMVRGSGGQDWAQIEASAFDANGNPVPDGTWVRFEIIGEPPAGVNINNHGMVDSAQTSSGLAVATLNAGTGVGPVQIQACVNASFGQQCAPASGTVVAGPPFEIQIGVDEEGTDVGGAAWDVEISALVKDLVQNNVINGTAVFFTVAPEEFAQILSEFVVVGNENADGDAYPGVAYTTLRYTSETTNQEVLITATTGNQVAQTFTFILPIQVPDIELYAIPGSWHFVANGNPCRIELRALVRDGHFVRINGQEVYYSAARGRIYTNQNGTGPTTSIAVTGPEFGGIGDGICSLWLVEQVDFIFPDDLTPEIPGEVSAEVVGFEDAQDTKVINFRR